MRRIVVDNDEFVGLNGRDRWYSSGVRLEAARTSPSPTVPAWLSRQCTDNERSLDTSGWSLGQNIYTQDIRDSLAVDPNDRPVAAYLYLEKSGGRFSASGDAAWALAVGVTGPAALGEPLQNGIHRVLGVQQVALWDQQLRPRLALSLRASCTRRWALANGGSAPQLRPTLSAGVATTLGSLVNEMTAHLGFAVGPAASTMRAPIQAREAQMAPPGTGTWGLIVGMRVRAVAYNALLDGPTYGYRSLTRHRPVVGEVFAEVQARIARRWRLSYAIMRRSFDFDSPGFKSSFSPQTYGQLTLRRDWSQ